jgi:fused signal recognition particle receptor
MSWIVLLVIAAAIAIGLYLMIGRKPKEGAALPEGEANAQLPAKQALADQAPRRSDRPQPAQSKLAADSAPRTASSSARPPSHPPRAAAARADSAAAQGGGADQGPEPQAGQAVSESRPKRAQDVQGVRRGLGKTRSKEGFFGRLATLIGGRKEIDPAIADELEEVLLSSDVGVTATQEILRRIREGMDRKELNDEACVWAALRAEARRILSIGDGGLELRTKPTVILLVGVNGSGKTTTIGKLATQLKASGKKVVLAAGDTFRAAAVQQLEVWGRRVGCEVVRGKDGADPGAVIFDAIQKASSMEADVVLADTAGRLHTKTPLMDELKKIAKTMGKATQGAPHETWLIIDSTNGQNAVAQSRQFAEALPLTGLVLTKLDGTAKGGVVLGICDELKVPVRFIGLGERADDLRPFDADEFVEALLGQADADEVAA